MNRNIEIKARVEDLRKTRLLAEALSDSPPEVLVQEDVFFIAPNGRLKLRTINDSCSELIYYERSDETGPKSSEYILVPVPDPRLMRQLLTSALGVRGVVRKRRTLCMVGNTRIHLDEVEGLGDFLELEVVLQPGGSAEEGVKIAHELMRRLQVNDASLVAGAYIDLPSTGAK
jgi:predicted adenylyl cyclase CyaB